MNQFALNYKRLYEAFNYRLRSFANQRWADHYRPTSITIGLTYRCNARCVHCDIWKNRGPETTPSVEQWRRVLTDLKKWLGPVQVTFSGGEALMQPFTVNLVQHAVDVGLVVEVLSNGYWHNQTRIERLAASNPWRITVSLDGIGATHSLIRGREDFFERTENSLKTLDRMRRENGLKFKIRLKTVVMRQNLEAVHEVAHYANERAGYEVFYQPIEQNYNTEEDPHWFEGSDNWPYDTERAVAVVHDLIELKQKGLPIANSFAQLQAMEPYFRSPALLRLATQSHSAHENKMPCSALTNLEMRAGGEVVTCVMKAPIGNIQERGIREIWEARPKWWREGCCQTTANVAPQMN
jgi:MoaA/NifB/PqqE/SkfB family radical SAM enzyme